MLGNTIIVYRSCAAAKQVLRDTTDDAVKSPPFANWASE